MTIIYKPLHCGDDGIFAGLPAGSIINIGGTASSVFTVGGRALLFADGTPTGPGANPLNLQTIYNNSTDVDGFASIKLATGKDFVIYDDTNNSVFFKIDSETGAITISGDLNIVGETVKIESALEVADHWLIQPSTGIHTTLQIEPKVGVSQSVDFINVRTTFGGPVVFRIDNLGNTTLATLTTTDGKVNNVHLANLQTSVNNHILTSASIKHTAAEISVITNSVPQAPAALNVQEALVGLSAEVTSLRTDVTTLQNAPPGGGGGGNVFGYSLLQDIPNSVWYIMHNKNTRNLTCTVYDSTGLLIFPDTVQIIDENNVQITFGAPQSGKVILMVFA